MSEKWAAQETLDKSHEIVEGVTLRLPTRPIHSGCYNVAELFCGPGGFSEGFSQTGFNIMLGVDNHLSSIQTFALNHPESATIAGDITQVTMEQYKHCLRGRRVHVLLSGIPCQGFSRSNRKQHDDDERNFMYKETMRFASVFKPHVIIFENVSRMTKVEKIIEGIQQALGEHGYTVSIHFMDAQDYGVPQRRERAFIMAILSGKPLPKPVPRGRAITVGEAIGDIARTLGSLPNHNEPRQREATKQRIADTLPGQPLYDSFKQRIRLDENDVAPTIVSGGVRPQPTYGHPTEARSLTVRERARLMGFPDTYRFEGSDSMGRVQTGNAVCPPVAKAIAKSVYHRLLMEVNA